ARGAAPNGWRPPRPGPGRSRWAPRRSPTCRRGSPRWLEAGTRRAETGSGPGTTGAVAGPRLRHLPCPRPHGSTALGGREAPSRLSTMKLTGKVALITNVSHFMGPAITEEFCREGASVGLDARGADA